MAEASEHAVGGPGGAAPPSGERAAGPPIPEDEASRLELLNDYDILDTLPEAAYDDIAAVASAVCGTPMALVSLVDADRQWFKARVGVEATETPRAVAFCAHAICEPTELFVIPDALADPRFVTNPLVTDDPKFRFYAGAPLLTAEGNALGTLCVMDEVPRKLTERQKQALLALSRQVMALLELRRTVGELARTTDRQRQYEWQLEEYQRQLEEYHRQLESNLTIVLEQSVTDELTGLRNRRAMLQRLDEEVDRAGRYETPLSLALIDVDDFKAYNDTRGHPAGDAVLEKIARLARTQFRSVDLVARYGGEEFAVVMANTDANGAYVIAERFRRAVEQAEWEEGPVTISVGLATYGPRARTAVSLIQAADKALYRAKREGRNRVVAAVGAAASRVAVPSGS